MNFFDFISNEDDTSPFQDWLDLEALQDNAYLDCSWDLKGAPSRFNYPSPKAFVALTRDGISNSFEDYTIFGDSSFLITIDPGAGLAIFPDKSDFVGHIQPINLRLGGMANEIKIGGNRNVE